MLCRVVFQEIKISEARFIQRTAKVHNIIYLIFFSHPVDLLEFNNIFVPVDKYESELFLKNHK
jgi:transcriptional antiterminator